jgi:hypothetical protein
MRINLKNVGDIILSDSRVKQLLPDLSHHFDAWKLGVLVPALRPTAKKAALDMLEALDGDRVEVLEKHFGEKITVESVSYNIVKTVEIPISDLEFELQKHDGFQVCLTTDGENASVTFWR